ncbi:MAG: aminotransferase class I/II-fold pyridoxal phosphate-dependent enzyme, partial [Lachnospiraceae bacterium]|nr:aminotransferase class I/II-fold pyridoxal phosphate-dependent enzyme [Lachnospiraceae bacterium]
LYDDTVVCYSYSKSLSLPGDRIGDVLVGPKAADRNALYAAVAGAGRSLGYVCAPTLMQRVIARCTGQTSDLRVYRENRDLLYNALTAMGYEAVYPDGAFYLFVKVPGNDAGDFSERAKAHGLLLVPSDSFGCGGYVRIAYCVSTDMIRRSLPAFEELMREYR